MNKMLAKYDRLPLPAKATLWFLVCTITQKSVSFITVPIFTRLMEKEQYGLYSTYLSVLNIITVFCTLNLESCAYINGISKEEDARKKEEIAVNLLTLSFVATLVVCGVYLFFRQYLNKMLGMTTPMMLFMFLEILGLPPIRFWSYKQRFSYNYIKLVALTISITVINALSGILFVVLAQPENQAMSRIVSFSGIQLIFGLTVYVSFVIKAHRLFLCRDWKRFILLHLPLLPHNLSMSLLYSSDRIMINQLISASAAAIYSVSYSAGMVVQLLKTCIVDALRPWVYEKLKRQEPDAIRTNMNLLMLIVAAISFVFSLCAPEVISILAPAGFSEAVYVIPPVAGSSYFMFLYHIFVTVETYYEKTKQIMYASITAAVLNIVLNLFLIPRYGYVAAGYTTMVSYIVLTFIHYLIIRKIEQNAFDGREMFEVKAIVSVSVIVLLVIIAVSAVYKMTAVRFLILAVICVVAFLYRRKFKQLVKTFQK